MQTKKDTKDVEALLLAVTPLFAGKSPQVQGRALADLLALWLAGHVVRGDPEGTKYVREALLDAHLEKVWRLVPINYRDHIEPKLAQMRIEVPIRWRDEEGGD
jgi:hypothetical protein